MSNHDRESFKPLTISLNELPASMVQAEEHENYAAHRARLLLGCYRTGDANDPETYVAAVAATLAHFPDEVITQVTHPVTGMPSRMKWLPSVSEVRMACEDVMEPIEEARRREERIARQLADRERYEALRSKLRPTYNELKAKFGDNWGIAAEVKRKTAEPAPTKEQLRHHYQHYDLGFRPRREAAE